MDQKIGQTTVGELVPYFIVLGVLLIFILFCIGKAISTSKVKKAQKKQRDEDKKNGITRYQNILHIGGLNAPDNCKCSAILSPEGLTVNCSGNEFFLTLAKIKNVDFQFDIDEKLYLQRSTLKGLAGAAAFGVSGAIIGSAPKTKTRKEVKSYAIISYENSKGEFATFILRDEYPNSQICNSLVATLKPLINVQINKVVL